MKIAIISSYAFIVKNGNYGALLQYFALQEYFKKRGHYTFWIRFIISKDNVISRLKDIIKYLCYKNGKENSKRRKQFLNFSDKYLNLSKDVYFGNEEINNNPPIADYYITGSDQVWGGTLAANFLTFINDKSKKISYAASFGREVLSDEDAKIIAPWLRNFNKLSVREKSGIDICKKLGIDEVVQHIDPTLLLNKDEYPYDLPKEKKIVFGYLINLSKKNNLNWEYVETYTSKKKSKLIISTAEGSENFVPQACLVYPTIKGWLGYYKMAESIITNTFHGTIFAIIFNKPFVIILQKGQSESQNGRFYSLLETLELTDRIWDMACPIEEIMDVSIDWENVRMKINNLKLKTDMFFSSINL